MASATVLLKGYKEDLEKAILHLEYSYKKVQKLPTAPKNLDEESLETWESFSARFARVSDIFITKYLRAYLKTQDPGFEGTLIDSLNAGEKAGLIEDANEWMIIRSLRNITAHEYTNEKLEKYLKDLLKYTPTVLKVKSLI